MNGLIHHFGAGIRHLREKHDWSQEQLAERAGLNRSYVGEIERGSVAVSIVTMGKLAQAFGVPVTALLLSTEQAAAPVAGAIVSRTVGKAAEKNAEKAVDKAAIPRERWPT